MASNGRGHHMDHHSCVSNDYDIQYFSTLQSLVHDVGTLSKHGYTVKPLTALDFEGLKRCSGCRKPMKKFLRPTQPPAHVSNTSSTPSIKDAEESKVPKLRCMFHPGTPVDKLWTCCRRHVAAEPCAGRIDHVAAQYPGVDQLERSHQYHATPKADSRKNPNIRAAVAIDCEMGMSKAGDSELIRVTVVDYFTSTPLIDRLVWPDAELLHPNTKYSGVTWAQLHYARNTSSCLFGIANARKAVWNFVGPETIVVGHAASNDLRSLRWIHHAVVDSLVLGWIEQTPIREAKEAERRRDIENQRAIKAKALRDKKEAEKAAKEQTKEQKAAPRSDAVPCPILPIPVPIAAKETPHQNQATKTKSRGITGDLSLKSLTLGKLGRDIQNAGNKGHDSLEDAIAARDIVHWFITNPSILGEELDKLRIAKLEPTTMSGRKRKAEDVKGGIRVVQTVKPSLLD
ncbi:hypothetical protein FKW77_000900 [Venturia effusa]|uniref:Exonuclease domain-containing protein n=1 Tax=Venturia effusa TaxID=50376 RepID=A0A517LAB8_9PEZI|nr:hypothetical protein FKW77_000900 [Venturia effusa]